ncbi:MAG TPA: 3-isopropylmalate dehydrogenase [Patescibacteria group bacterium]|nr:3-isopropylmalate dehydrogenase [Patescibacteria group bacterium]
MKVKIVVLPGDGIGPEVTAVALEVVATVAARFGHELTTEKQLLGGCAIDAYGTALPESTLEACLLADAVLLGAVGGPKWDDPTAKVRPEQGLLGLRKALGLFANLRPVKPHPDLLRASPLKRERLEGVDFLVIRELTGGIYFGKPQERRMVDGEEFAIDTMIYGKSEISRIAHLAFVTARQRRGKVTSVDKANVLESSRLWRQTVAEVADSYPDIPLENLLVDAAAMHLLTRPGTFDVIVTANLFGDILTDEASVLSGSMGNLPSASLGEIVNGHGYPRGLYEPIHGSAPDIAGQGIANPIGTILSTAMMLRHSLGLIEEAQLIESVIDQVISDGFRTTDLARDKEKALGTRELGQVIVNRLN